MDPVVSKLNKLPPELSLLIQSDDVITTITDIAAKHGIPDTWIGEVVRSTNEILAGVMEPSDFIPIITDEFYCDKEEALKIALEINDAIFAKVKPQLASLHHIEDEKIARRINVPKKPRQENIAPATQLTEEPPRPIAPSADVAPAERIAPVITLDEVPPSPTYGAIPSPLTAAFTAPVVPSMLPPSAAPVVYGTGGIVTAPIPGVNAPYIVPPPSQNPSAVDLTTPPPRPQPIQTPVNTSLQNKLGTMRSTGSDPYRESV